MPFGSVLALQHFGSGLAGQKLSGLIVDLFMSYRFEPLQKICRAENEDATELTQGQQVLLVTGHDAVGVPLPARTRELFHRRDLS